MSDDEMAEPPPDFATLYAEGEITPRAAALLWLGAELLVDPAGLTPPEDWLPSIAVRQGPEFAERMREVVASLRDRLAQGRLGTVENMAEQVALAAIVEQARAVEEERIEDPEHEYEAWISELPGDDLLDQLEEILLPDSDHDWLYEPEMDGIENDEEFVAQMRAPNLHPKRWFEPFYAH